jgi:tetratricopeptide (TPR) repeat protein
MKILSASKILLVAACLVFTPARAGDVEDGLECLERGDTVCAGEAVSEISGENGFGEHLLRARYAFFTGEMELAASEMSLAAASEPEQFSEGSPFRGELELMAGTAEVHSGLIESTVGDITVVHHPSIDRILVHDAVEVLNVARERIAPLLGGDPPIPLRVEIYPTGADFTACTGLPIDAVKTTGVVAISKWNRLLLISPRSMGGGYDWQSTLVHEWIHLVASWHSADRAPVWLQEGIAKGLDMLHNTDEFELSLGMQSLLATALRDRDFVSFEEMHPSFALLSSAERAGLAYAQVSTMMTFLRAERGSDALARVLERVKNGDDAMDATAHIYGGSFTQFQEGWAVWLEGLDLMSETLALMPTVIDGQGGEFSDDPTLAESARGRERTRLGDLMIDRGHPEAALVYYQDAVPESGPPGPTLAGRIGSMLTELGRTEEALALLVQSVDYYPEHSATRVALGRLYLRNGNETAARQQLERGLDIDPYQDDIHELLSDLLMSMGEVSEAERHRSIIEVLRYE